MPSKVYVLLAAKQITMTRAQKCRVQNNIHHQRSTGPLVTFKSTNSVWSVSLIVPELPKTVLQPSNTEESHRRTLGQNWVKTGQKDILTKLLTPNVHSSLIGEYKSDNFSCENNF
jgi:hypothetical protein